MARKARRPAPVTTLPSAHEPLLGQLASCRRSTTQSWDDAWVGLEPTFSNRKTIERWRKHAARDETGFFYDPRVLSKQDEIGRAVLKRYRKLAARGDEACPFASAERTIDKDPYGIRRQNLCFRDASGGPTFELRLSLDPETYEFTIKPVPLRWLYDRRFQLFLQRFVWDVAERERLVVSTAHGGGQFSFSAKTFLQGCLLADHIASKLNHPELSTWILDYPNPDDRPFRATARRFQAFRGMIEQYWKGAFHPASVGTLTVENALLDSGFEPACNPRAGQMDPRSGPRGNAQQMFQTNFAFARCVRLRAQSVHPGYWQTQHPAADGFRPDQIMRYGEGNLNRMQIAGELHVKSGKVLDRNAVPDLEAPLELGMLYDAASWEQRAQISRTSAHDMIEAVLLEAHYCQWLLAHPHVKVRDSLLQDQLLFGAEELVRRRAPKVLARLHADARRENLESSNGRIRSDWIEPETLFWAAWHVLDDGERAEIAVEAVAGFVERVYDAASMDPRGSDGDPMEPHRHRVHPILWKALAANPGAMDANPEVQREVEAFTARRPIYMARRPAWSPTGERPPWRQRSRPGGR